VWCVWCVCVWCAMCVVCVMHLYLGMVHSDSIMSAHSQVSVKHTTSGFSIAHWACSCQVWDRGFWHEVQYVQIVMNIQLSRVHQGNHPAQNVFQSLFWVKRELISSEACSPLLWTGIRQCSSFRMSEFEFFPTLAVALGGLFPLHGQENHHCVVSVRWFRAGSWHRTMSLRSRTRLTLVLSGCCEGVRFLHVAIVVCDGFDLVASKFCMLVWLMEVHYLHPICFLFCSPSFLACPLQWQSASPGPGVFFWGTADAVGSSELDSSSEVSERTELVVRRPY